MAAEERHLLSVLVENKPGVLTRIAGMFARRGYNIHSLAVGPTDDPTLSRLTVVVGDDAVQVEQIVKQLNKLVHVLKILELDPAESVKRELQMVKVDAPPEVRGQIMQLVEVFRAKVCDVDHETVTIEASGSPDKLEALQTMLEPYGIRELVRSGTISLARGSSAMLETGSNRPRIRAV